MMSGDLPISGMAKKRKLKAKARKQKLKIRDTGRRFSLLDIPLYLFDYRASFTIFEFRFSAF
jgi:hypothetical protein